VQKANELIRHLAREGGAILLGRGANLATAGIDHGLHLRLVAPASERANRTAALLKTDPAEAAALNARRDAARQRYVRATFNADIADPTAYDLTINTAHVPVETIVDLVAGFVRAPPRHPGEAVARGDSPAARAG
jgi:cytidylate kinase